MGRQAFTGKRSQQFHLPPEAIRLIGLDTEDGPEHILFDRRVKHLVKVELAKAIDSQGVLNPVIVRKNGDVAEIIAGRNRVKAARLANTWRQERGDEPLLVPVIIRRCRTDADLLEILISENELRDEDDAMNRATKAQKLLDLGRTLEEVGRCFGVEAQTISRWLKLLDCDTSVQAAVESGEIKASVAIELARLTREEQADALKELRAAGNLTAAAAKSTAKTRKDKGGSQGRSGVKTTHVRPSRVVLRRVAKDGAESLTAEQVALIKWAAGDGPAPEWAKPFIAEPVVTPDPALAPAPCPAPPRAADAGEAPSVTAV